MPKKDTPRLTSASTGTRDFELIETSFGADTDAAIEKWVYETLTSLKNSHQDLHTSKIPRWRDWYDGKPANEKKNSPWPNAANLVVQVIGESVDNIVARVLGFIFPLAPLWKFQYFAKVDDPDAAELKRRTLEDFMDTIGYDTGELDLYRVYGQWFTDCAKLGTAFVKVLPEKRIEAQIVGYTDRKLEFKDKTIYDGFKAVKLRHEDVLMEPGAQTVGESRMVAHRRIMSRYDLELRASMGWYEKDKIEKILESSDRTGPDYTQQKEEMKEGVTQTMSGDAMAQWDIWECYFPWFKGGHVFRLIYSYHLRTRTVLRSVFNFVPDNETPIVRTKLAYSNDLAYGKGYAQMLGAYQEEISTVHNQRIDNATAANARMFRISAQARNLDSQIEIAPGSALVGNKDDIEALQLADVYPSTFQNEEVTLSHVRNRAGISPAVSGSGTGTASKSKGVYSSQGTIAMMEAGNSRTDLATADFRHAHQKLGSLLTAFYGKFGVGAKADMFGLDKTALAEALKEFKENRLRIPIRASNASLNREASKQNAMILSGVLQRGYTAVGQMMQAIGNPTVPPDVKKYLQDVIRAMNQFNKRMLKDFGYDQPDEFVPDPEMQDASQAVHQLPQPVPQPGAGQGPVQPPGMGGVPQGFTAPPGAGNSGNPVQ